MRNPGTSRWAAVATAAIIIAASPATRADGTPDTDRRIEALEQKIQALEKKLEQAQGSGTGSSALEQKVLVLERKNEIAEETAATAKKTAPLVKAGDSGFSLESADGKNTIKLRGLLQVDHRAYLDGANDVRNRSNQRAGSLDANGFADARDTWLMRRVRPTLEGTLLGIYDYRFSPDFGGGSVAIIDAYVDARFTREFQVRVGKYKPYVGLERLQGGNDLKFLERSYVTNALLPNRDLGVSVHGDLADNRVTYGIGLNNGVADGGNISSGTEFDGDKEFTGRLFATPWVNDVSPLAGLGFGFAATWTAFEGERNLNFTDTSAADATRNGLPSYVSDGQNTFFRYSSAAVADGSRLRLAPQLHYYFGSFGLLGEWAQVQQEVSLSSGGSPAAGGNTGVGGVLGDNTVITPDTNRKLSHDAWQVAGTWLFTGEEASFKGVKPAQPFGLDGSGPGAWEVAFRYSQLNLDKDTFRNPAGTAFTGGYASLADSAESAHSFTVGLNWYLNQNSRVQLNYSQTSFDGGAADGTASVNADGSNVRDRETERAVLSRVHVSY
jgi:phosphate-selective porin OprO/OprP